MTCSSSSKSAAWPARGCSCSARPAPSEAAYALFVDAVSDNLQLAIALLGRRAAGDYSPDENLQTFPAFIDSPERKALGLDCWQLFEAYVKAKKPAEGTVSRWNAVFSQLGSPRMPHGRGSLD